MPIRTTYVCDGPQCGRTSTEPFQYWNLTVTLQPLTEQKVQQYSDPWTKTRSLWCRACCERVGLLPPSELKPADVPAQPPSLDEVVRRIAEAAARALLEGGGNDR